MRCHVAGAQQLASFRCGRGNHGIDIHSSIQQRLPKHESFHIITDDDWDDWGLDLTIYDVNSEPEVVNKVAKEEPVKIVKYMCHICGKEFDNKKQLAPHIFSAHDRKRKRKLEEITTAKT